MKVQCSREALSHAFQTASSVVPSRSPKPILQNVKFEASAAGGVLSATDLDVGIRMTVPGIEVDAPGTAVLPKERFGSILRESIDEVMAFKQRGGGAIVDVSSIGLGRDPNALVQVSRATGLQIVMGAGWYQKQFHPADMDRRTVEQLTDVIVRDVTIVHRF